MDQKKLVEYLSFWVVNSVVLIVCSFIFSGNVVLGNDKLSLPMAAVVSGLIITVLTYLFPLLINRVGYKIKDEKVWGALYVVANAVIVWVIKRFALLVGLGIASIFYVVLVALILTAAQWGIAIATGATKKK